MIRCATLLLLGASLAACLPARLPSYLAAPTDPKLRVRDPAYAPVTAGVNNYEVTGPKDWIEQNRQVAPGSAPERGDSNDAARRGR